MIPTKKVPENLVEDEQTKHEKGWACMMVAGPLEFELVGILSSIAEPLARAGISIYALSTYDTDYILVKLTQLEDAERVLDKAGFEIRRKD